MLLSPEEYRRGLVKWQGGSPLQVTLKATDETVKSSAMTDPTGNVPDLMLPPGSSIEAELLPSEELVPPETVSWDRVVDDEVEARGWQLETGVFQLLGMIAPAPSDRIVVATPYLRWEDGAVVRVGDVVVRFTRRMVLEMGGSIEASHERDDKSVFIQTFGTHQLDGSFIDIIAPAGIGEHSDIAYSILGLLALVMGSSAVGDIAFVDHTYPHRMGDQLFAMHGPNLLQQVIPSSVTGTLRIPRPLRLDDLQEFDRLLAILLEDKAIQEDVMLALRWYERAVRAGSDIDRYMAAVVGIESLVTHRSKRLGFVSPIAELLSDKRVVELLAPLREDYPEDQVDRILGRLLDKNPSLKDRFSGVANTLGLEEEVRLDFKKTVDARGPVVHGSTGVVTEGLPRKAIELLEALLQVVFTSGAQADQQSNHVISSAVRPPLIRG